jgi:DNA-binding MarR family transcriptional regulator
MPATMPPPPTAATKQAARPAPRRRPAQARAPRDDEPDRESRTSTAASAAEILDTIRALERALLLQRRAEAPALRAASVADRRTLECVAYAPEPLSVGQVAERLRRDPSSASVSVSRLVERGLLRKEPDPVDRRQCLLSATPAGRRLADQTPDRTRAALERALASWPEGRARTAAQLITQLAEALTPVRAESARTSSARDRRRPGAAAGSGAASSSAARAGRSTASSRRPSAAPA